MYLEELVERADAAWEDDQRTGEVHEPELAHGESLEVQRQAGGNVRVGALLGRDFDVDADGGLSREAGPAVGGLHDARAASGGDEVLLVGGEGRAGPVGELPGEGLRRGVKAGHVVVMAGAVELVPLLAVLHHDAAKVLVQTVHLGLGIGGRLDPGRAKKHDGVVDAVTGKNFGGLTQFFLELVQALAQVGINGTGLHFEGKKMGEKGRLLRYNTTSPQL